MCQVWQALPFTIQILNACGGKEGDVVMLLNGEEVGRGGVYVIVVVVFKHTLKIGQLVRKKDR
jgi:hypothetical protein